MLQKTPRQLTALAALYTLYDETTTAFSVACTKGCATCCSVNVTLTTLEAAYLHAHPVLQDGDVKKRVVGISNQPHFVPSVTINRLAHACLHAQEVPEETGMHAPGSCPFLDKHNQCRVYANRPFSCRSMFSTSRCQHDGAAEMAPFLYTINLAVCQLIEHLDQTGGTGNMVDMLAGRTDQIITNNPLPGFPVPPEDRPRLALFLEKLHHHPVADGSLADLFPKEMLAL